MSQLIYFSDPSKPNLWESRFLTNVSGRVLDFLTWDAGPDLAQATWEWPLCYWDHAKTTLEPWEQEEAQRIGKELGWV